MSASNSGRWVATVRRSAAGLAAVALLAACTPHPVGPARTSEAFTAKAVTTAEAASSAVETVRLAAEVAADDGAFGPFTSVAISAQEDHLAGVQATFGSIQPPDARADELRRTLDGLLRAALDHVADVRIAARRGRLGDLAEVARPLGDDADAIQAFIEEHGA